LTEEEFEERDYRIMGHAFASQNRLGRLCEEGVYQRDLQARLLADGFQSVHIEEPVTVSHADFTKVYSLDLIADDAVYELKTVTALNNEHQAQLLNYLFLLGVPRGKLVNFRPAKVQGRIHATSLTTDDRRRIRIESNRWQDISGRCGRLHGMMSELLADWGAWLACELYQQALTHYFGGESQVVQKLALKRDGISLGTQRFHLHAAGVAFRVTAIAGPIEAMEDQLRRLLSLTDLRVIQWINLNRTDIQFATIFR
jgi:GxxExxY protein